MVQITLIMALIPHELLKTPWLQCYFTSSISKIGSFPLAIDFIIIKPPGHKPMFRKSTPSTDFLSLPSLCVPGDATQ
jgi:hypothetical protein